jgi:hypothetical protein
MVQQVIPLFVVFRADTLSFNKLPEGFKINFAYPVYAIDVVEFDEGDPQTNFLLSSHDGKFKWVNSEDVVRNVESKYKPRT